MTSKSRACLGPERVRSRLVASLGSVLVPATIRAAAVALSLGAVLLSYHALAPGEFTSLNLILFCVAIGSSLAAPINRSFWTKNPAHAFAPAAASTIVLVSSMVIAGYFIPSVARGNEFAAFVGIFPALMYVVAKNLERFLYGRTMAQESISRALLITLGFAFAEIISLCLMLALGLTNVGYRLLLPAVIFVPLLVMMNRKRYIIEILLQFKSPGSILNNIKIQTFNKPGPSVLLLTAIVTLAGMVDRLLIAYFPIFGVQFGADYLLALSYAVALQTVLTLLFDISRRHIYFQGDWQQQSTKYALAIVGSLLLTCLAAVVSYPFLLLIHIVPRSVPWIMWASMILRSTALLACYICFVDMFQAGHTKPIIFCALLVLGFVALFFAEIMLGVGGQVASWISGIAFLAILCGLCARMFIALKSHAGVGSGDLR